MAILEQISEAEGAELDLVSSSELWGVSLELAHKIIEELNAWREDDLGYDTYMAEGGATVSDIGSIVTSKEVATPVSDFAIAA